MGESNGAVIEFPQRDTHPALNKIPKGAALVGLTSPGGWLLRLASVLLTFFAIKLVERIIELVIEKLEEKF